MGRWVGDTDGAERAPPTPYSAVPPLSSPPPQPQGLDEIEDDMEARGVDLTGEKEAGGVYETKDATRSEFYKTDPSGYRTGNAPEPQLAKVLLNTCDDAVKVLDQGMIQRRENLSAEACRTELRNLKGAVMIA